MSKNAPKFALLVALFLSSHVVAQNTPVMEYTSVLHGLGVFHKTGGLKLEGKGELLTAVFLPANPKVEAVLTKAGSKTPIHRQDFYLSPINKAFTSLQARGKHKEFKFTQPSEYVLTYVANGKIMTSVPFTVVKKSNDDAFDPQTHWHLEGPWSKWTHVFARVKDGDKAQIEFRMWGKRPTFISGGSDKYTVELKKDGDVIGVSRIGHIGSAEWQHLDFPMHHPDSKGRGPFRLSELQSRDGTYDFVVKRNGEDYGVWQCKVAGGKLQFHPREATTYKPRHEYIVPRYAGFSRGSGESGNTFWMERLDASTAQAASNATAKQVKGPTDEQLKRWEWLPRSIDPNRSFELVTTDIETRSDTMISAGEDLIAFGTGFPTGVKYMKVGDTQAREIPDGETYSSMVFRVVGKKIVLVKKNQIFIFDTESEKLAPIPKTDIFLYDVVGGLHRRNLLNTNGYLVATVNKAKEVTDRTIIKVIDISGDQPQIIPIKNADYVDRDVNCVAVDAKHGIVAVSSTQKKFIAAAPIAPLANQHIVKLDDYRGISRQQIFVDDEQIVYADGDRKVRVLDLEDGIPKAITEESFGSSSNGFFVRKGRLAVATRDKKGTRYKFAISDLDDKPVLVPGTGDAIKGTSGGLGMAGVAAIAIDKTVFIAGTPSGGIGVGEHLQVLDDNSGQWIPLLNEKGEVIAAIDVTTSMGLLAFKTGGRSSKTTIGYATYGQRIEIPLQTPGNVAAAKPVKASSSKTASTKPAIRAKGLSEIDQAKLDAYLESEKELAAAFTTAFGEAEGKKRTFEGIIKSIKNAGNEHLIEAYKAKSSLGPR